MTRSEHKVWKIKSKGSDVVHVHPELKHAIVDNKGIGINPGIFYRGTKYDSVVQAKRAAIKDR